MASPGLTLANMTLRQLHSRAQLLFVPAFLRSWAFPPTYLLSFVPPTYLLRLRAFRPRGSIGDHLDVERRRSQRPGSWGRCGSGRPTQKRARLSLARRESSLFAGHTPQAGPGIARLMFTRPSSDWQAPSRSTYQGIGRTINGQAIGKDKVQANECALT